MTSRSLIPFVIIFLITLVVHAFNIIIAIRTRSKENTSSNLSWVNVGLTAIVVILSIIGVFYWSKCDKVKTVTYLEPNNN